MCLVDVCEPWAAWSARLIMWKWVLSPWFMMFYKFTKNTNITSPILSTCVALFFTSRLQSSRSRFHNRLKQNYSTIPFLLASDGSTKYDLQKQKLNTVHILKDYFKSFISAQKVSAINLTWLTKIFNLLMWNARHDGNIATTRTACFVFFSLRWLESWCSVSSLDSRLMSVLSVTCVQSVLRTTVLHQRTCWGR